MSTQPPSFEPHRRKSRPLADDAKVVGNPRKRRPPQPTVRRDPASSQERPAREQVPPKRSDVPPRDDDRKNLDPRKNPGSAGPRRVSVIGNGEPQANRMPPAIPPARPQQSRTSNSASPRPVRSTGQPAPSYAPARPPRTANAAQGRPAPHQPPLIPTRQTPQGPTRRRRHYGRRIALALLVVVLLLIAWPFYLVSYGNSHLSHVEALSGATDTSGTTYLIVGSDKRSEAQVEAGDPTEGQRSDTIMLLDIPSSGAPALVSLPRDSWVEIPGHGEAKINAAYSLGGPQLLVQTVENLSGLTIDHYVEVSMSGVQELTDAVGGVNLCLDYTVNDEYSGLNWEAGCHDADGTMALAFSRMRYSDPRGDIGRTERQRQVVGAILHKTVTPSTLLNPMKQRALVGAVAQNLTTDTNTSIMGLGRAGLALRTVMGPDGLMGVPPISTIDYRVGGQSAVQLDPDAIGPFFEKMKNGQLTAADFGQIG